MRATVLPPNRRTADVYCEGVWQLVHTLTASVLSLDSSMTDPGNFKFHLEAEEARLGKNPRAVNYVIDGTDTLALIAGGGCIEKVRTGNAIYTIHDSSRYSINRRPYSHSYTCL